MNASENRKYMEAIREMVNSKGGFHVKNVLKAHGVPTTCTVVLNRLKWTKGQGRAGSVWIHGKPVNEAELLQLAIAMRLKLEAVNAENYEKYYTKKKEVMQAPAMRATSVQAEQPKQDKLVIIQEAPVKTVAAPKPARRTPAKRGEVSILWGMIKWTR